MQKILIIKTSALGDIVQTYPLLSYLKQKFPNSFIDWVVEKRAKELITSHPDVNQAFIVDTRSFFKKLFFFSFWKELILWRRELRKRKYDFVFDVQGNIKSGLILWNVRAKKKVGFGKHSIKEWPALLFSNYKIEINPGDNIRKDYLELAKAFFNDQSSFQDFKPVILKKACETSFPLKSIEKAGKLKFLICPGSIWPNKQLEISTWKSFLEHVDRALSPFFTFLWGTDQEKKSALELNACFHSSIVLDKMPLVELQNFMNQMDLIIAVDSLPLHLAATTTTKTFSFFGPSSKQKYAPMGNQHGSIQGICPYGEVFEKRCSKLRTCKTGACLHHFQGKELFESFMIYWTSISSSSKRSVL